MNTRQAKKSDNSVAGGDEGGVAAAVNIPDLEDLVTKAVEAAVRVLRNERIQVAARYERLCC